MRRCRDAVSFPIKRNTLSNVVKRSVNLAWSTQQNMVWLSILQLAIGFFCAKLPFSITRAWRAFLQYFSGASLWASVPRHRTESHYNRLYNSLRILLGNLHFICFCPFLSINACRAWCVHGPFLMSSRRVVFDEKRTYSRRWAESLALLHKIL